MASYRVRVSTGSQPGAGTADSISLTLVGTRGCSPKTPLDGWGPDFCCGGEREYVVVTPKDLGELLLLRVHKEPYGRLPQSSWFLERVRVWPHIGGGGRKPTGGVGDPIGGDKDPVGGIEDPVGDLEDPIGDLEDPMGDSRDGSDESDLEEDDDDDDDEDDDGDEEEDEDEDDEDGEEADDDAPPEPNAEPRDPDDPCDPDEELEELQDFCGDDDDGGGDDDEGSGGGPKAPSPLYSFPCYRWLQGFGTWELAEGTARTPAQERHPLLQRHRRRVLAQQQKRYKLARFAPGLPWALPVGSAPDPDLVYSLPKAAAFYLRGGAANLETKLKGFLDRAVSWESLDAITRIFCFYRTPVTDYVVQHWQDDAFFGAQYLNGVNPVLLRRCSRLPHNFAVTPQMVAASLGPNTTLQREMEEGRLFLADYVLLDGIRGIEIDGSPTFLCAPMCLLHLGGDGGLRPIAIQLSQQPGPSSPVMVPQDPPWLWALAKAWVRSADFQVHEAVTHLLRAHLLGEVFALATRRQLAPQHPIYKLLLPHTRYTVHIAVLARRFLLNPGGVFDQAIALGRSGLLVLVGRGLRALRYRELLLPKDLRRRGVRKVPSYHYGSDGMRIWAAIRSFVSAVLQLYYPCDAAVSADPELQAWVGEIFHKAFLRRRRSGVPSALRSVRSLVTFVTMIIYTCSAHHAATNSGQFELGAFMPNMPAAMRQPPPASKAPLSCSDFLRALPAVNTTCRVLGVLWVLRNEPLDMRPLGCYPEQHFSEAAPRRLMLRFRRRLQRISRRIQRRNAALPLPYPYLDPRNVENSVAI